jgi:hypothetical protein
MSLVGMRFGFRGECGWSAMPAYFAAAEPRTHSLYFLDRKLILCGS